MYINHLVAIFAKGGLVLSDKRDISASSCLISQACSSVLLIHSCFGGPVIDTVYR